MTRNWHKRPLPAIAAWLALATGLTAAERLSVDSVRLSSGKLVVIAARYELVPDGTFEGPGGSRIEFDDGVVRSVRKGGTTQSIRGVEIDDGKILFSVDGGKNGPLVPDDGRYAVQGSTQPPDPRPQPSPQSFEIDDGEIVAVWIGGSI